jgi:predicted nucleic acid-binding protein
MARGLVDEADLVATSVAAFAEVRSTFLRLAREATLSAEDLASVRAAFLRDWDSYLKVRVLMRVYGRFGELTEEHGLRGFDALHVASWLEVLARAEGETVELSEPVKTSPPVARGVIRAPSQGAATQA